MVVDPNRREVSEPPKSKKALIISISLHLVVFLLIIFGLPHFKTEPILSEPVPIELVANIGELTTTNKKPVDAPKPKEEKPPEPPKKTEVPPKPPEPKKSTPEPPAEEVLKDPPKPDKPVEKVTEKAEKKIEKKPSPKKEKPKNTQQEDFDKLLKSIPTNDNLQPPDTDEVAKKMTEPNPSPNVSKFSDTLSMSEMDALRQQLSQCWNVMAGGVNAEDQVVELSVTVNEAMTVVKAEIVDQSKYNSNAFFRAAADSAKRALSNPLCTPLKLPPNKYSQWHQMTLVFDPKEMF